MTEDRPVGWVNPDTGARYVRNVLFGCALDNYEPVPRRLGHSLLEEWRETDGTIVYRLIGWGEETDATRALYLIDDGRTVRPYFVASWTNGDTSRILLHPFPVNVKPDGTPRLRSDNGQPVDYGTWMLGPRRAYHLKITEE